MTKTTVHINGEKLEYSSKKRMLKVVGAAILDDEEHPMTVRQLYYRFVAMDLVENKESQYDYLGEAIKEARLEGLVDWDDIEDRTRGAAAGDHDYVQPRQRFESAREHLERTPRRHHLPLWTGQDSYVEVWVEKEALSAVFERVADELGVVSLACRGYPSITTLKNAADRLRSHPDKDRHIVYFGDHDPSGQDIERHVRETLEGTFGVPVSVERAALNREQIDEHELPPQPAKSSDSRYEDFVEEHGDMAVELDALPPETLRGLIRERVGEHYDEGLYEEHIVPRQESERGDIRDMVEEVLGDGE